MSKPKAAVSGLAVLALSLGAVGAAAYWSFMRLRELDPNVAAAIIAALAASVGAIYAQRKSRLREIEESHRAEKVAVYNVFMDIVDHITGLSAQGKLDSVSEGEVPPEIAAQFSKLRRGLLIWASPKVIKSYEAFRLTTSTEPTDVLLKADDVYRAMREDLRNSNFGLNRGDLVRLFLKDPSELKTPGKRR